VVIGIAAAYFGAYYFAKDLLLKSFLTAVAGGFASAAVATGSLKAGLWGAVSAAAFWGIGTAFSKTITETIQTSVGPGEVVRRVASGNAIAKVAAHAVTGGALRLTSSCRIGRLNVPIKRSVWPLAHGLCGELRWCLSRRPVRASAKDTDAKASSSRAAPHLCCSDAGGSTLLAHLTGPRQTNQQKLVCLGNWIRRNALLCRLIPSAQAGLKRRR
jgi:hypothetical protein